MNHMSHGGKTLKKHQNKSNEELVMLNDLF
jgi:hypothetical protein